ncbi:SDR family oxidoreductase [Verrucomicrobia bacterium LW23]|nr:SDR family oxidoreductase [Verrucomicrobia bacterium LW23]
MSDAPLGTPAAARGRTGVPPQPQVQRVVVITGGQGDLACAMHEEFARQGWRVLAPGRAEMDVRDGASVAAWFDSARKDLGVSRLDALIGNAGITRDCLLARLDAQTLNDVLAVNLRGAYLCARAALPLMEAAGGGALVWIGSYAARTGPAGLSAYAAAKAGLAGFSQSLAVELGAQNIRSNVVMPGFLRTKMTLDLAPTTVAGALESHALGRFNTPQQAARFVVMLCDMEHVSGQVFQLDSRVGKW